jgi:hypothetical protein
MNTKLVMSVSALLMGVTGVALLFISQEIITYLSASQGSGLDAIALQILGTLYLAYAITNWTARSNLIGGIYGRPIALGNLCHFIIATLTLVRAFFRYQQTIILVSMIIYLIFAIAFGWIFLTHPVKANYQK